MASSFIPDAEPAQNNTSVSSFIPASSTTLQDNYKSVVDAKINPDNAAKVFKVAGQLNDSPAHVAEDVETAQKVAAMPDFAVLDKEYPNSSKFLLDPKNMAIGHDDIPNLVKHEQLTQAHGYLQSALAGLEGSSAGLAYRRGLPNIEVPANAPFTQKLTQMAGGLAGDLPAMGIGGLAGLVGGPLAPYASTAGAFALPAAIKQTLLEHYQNGDIATTGELMRRVLSISKETAKGAALGAFTAGGGAVAGRLLEGPLIEGAGFTMKAAVPAVKLAAGKAVGEVAGMTAGGAALEGKMPTGEDIASNVLLMGALHGSGVLRGKMADMRLETMKSEAAKAYIDNLAVVAQYSKLRARDPESHAQLLDNMGPSALMPVDKFNTLFQSKGIDPEQAAAKLGVSDSHSEANKNGGYVEIPMGTLQSKAIDPYRAEMAPDLKLNAEDYTPNEIAQHHEDIAQTVKTISDSADEAIKANPELQTAHDAIVKDFTDSATAAMTDVKGKGAKSSIKQAAKINADYTITESGKRGIDPMQFYQDNKPKMFGPGQSATGDNAMFQRLYSAGDNIYWHGSPSGDLRGGLTGLHLGTKEAATQALEARIGKPAVGEWDGTREYGKTLLAGTDTMERLGFFATGHNVDAPKEDYYPTEIKKYGDNSDMPMTVKPDIAPYKIKGSMTNTPQSPHDDFKANGYMAAQIKKGNPKNGYFYKNIAEDRGSISAVVPSGAHLERIEKGTLFQSPAESFGKGEEHVPAFKKLEWTEPDTSKFETIHGNLRQGKYSPNAEFTIWKIQGGEDTDKYRLQFGGHNVAPTPYSDFLPDKYKKFYGETFDTIEAAKSRAEALQKIVFKNVTQEKDRIMFDRYKKTGSYYSAVESGEIRISDHPFGVKAEREAESNVVISGGYLGNLKEDYVKKNINGVDFYYRGDGGKHDFVFPSGYALRNFRKIENSPEIVALLKSEPDNTLLFQTEKEPLAAYSKTKQGAVINMFKGANASSLLHELSHHWLENIHDFVKSGQADESYLKDWKITQDYLGHKTGEALTTAQHEKWAQSFEKYLMEGKAPSIELQGAFAKMKDWMMKVYDGVKNKLGIEITPEIRGVFDRMLASKDAIEAARADMGVDAGAMPELSGEALKARQMAESMLLKPLMEEMGQSNQVELAGKRVLAETNAETAIAQDPLFMAMDAIRKDGEHKTDAPVIADAQKFIDNGLSEERANAFEIQAELNGFSSGDELAQKILASEPRETVKAKLIESEMKPHERLNDPDALKEDALKALHTGDNMGHLLALEAQVLEGMKLNKDVNAELSAQRRVNASREWAEVKARAADTLGNKSIKEAGQFRKYYTLERQAAERVGRAMAAKDTEAALKAKREQLVSHALAAEAIRIRKEVASKTKFLDKFATRGADLLHMPFGFATQIDRLLANKGMAEPRQDDPALLTVAQAMAAKKELPQNIANATGYTLGDNGQWRKETIQDFNTRINEDNFGMELPPSVMVPDSMARYQGATNSIKLSDFRELHEAVKTIHAVGSIMNAYISGFIKGDIQEAAGMFRNRIEANIGAPHEAPPVFGNIEAGRVSKAIDAIKNIPDGMIPSKVNLLTLCEYLDLKKDDNGHYALDPDGPAKNNIYRPLEMAQNAEEKAHQIKAKELDDLQNKYYTKDEWKKAVSDPISKWQVMYKGKPTDVSLTRENIIHMFLYSGTKTGLDRLTRGFGIDEARIKTEINKLDKKDMDFAQGIIDSTEKLWPEAKALEMATKGLEPAKLEAVPIETNHGTYPGGYHPLAYDFDKSLDAYKNSLQRNADFKTHTATVAHTERGYMKARVSSLARPLRLDFSGLYNHLDDAIHDISYRKAVIDVSRFLAQPDTMAAVQGAIGDDGYRAIGDHVKAVASTQTEFLTEADKVAKWFRFKTTFATLGFRLALFPRRITEDIQNTMREIPFKDFAGGISDAVMNPADVVKYSHDNSVLMSNRGVNRESNLIDQAKKWQGKDGWLKAHAFIQDTLADQVMSNYTWGIVHRANIEKYGTEKAALIADESVIKTFGSGRMLDRVAGQRGSELSRLMYMYYSFHSMMFNRAWLQGKIGGLEYSQGNYGKSVATISNMVAQTVVIPALIDVFWSETMRNNPNPDEDKKKERIAARIAEAPFALFPVARNIAPALVSAAMGQRQETYHLSPMESSVENMLHVIGHGVNLAGQGAGVTEGKGIEQKFTEDAAQAAAVAIGAPQQLNTWTFNYIDWLNDEGEPNWRDLVTRRKKQ